MISKEGVVVVSLVIFTFLTGCRFFYHSHEKDYVKFYEKFNIEYIDSPGLNDDSSLTTVRIINHNNTPVRDALVGIGNIKTCNFVFTDSSGEAQILVKRGKGIVNVIDGGYIGKFDVCFRRGKETIVTVTPACTLIR